jgi:DNA-binding NarL/FixJ family response regulator
MKREIFIIHPSDIVRKGLNAIIRNYFNLDVTQLSGTADLAAFGEIKNAHLIVFAALTSEKDLATILRMKQGNRIHTIRIGPPEKGVFNSTAIDHEISLDSAGEEIRLLLSRLMSDNQAGMEQKPTDSELTVRERDVLKLVALGHANKEIAEKLFISIHTVISHRKNITEKLGIKSISGLTVYAILNKIIDTDQINMDQLI